MKNPYKSYKMKLTTLSPVFIGRGESILNLSSEEDFKNKVIKNDPQRLDSWCDYFLNFSEYKKNRDDRIPKEAKSPSLSGFLRFIEGNPSKPNQLKMFILSSGEAYIPGSSIKGAIRTALLSQYILDNKVNLNDAEDKIKEQTRGLQISDSDLIDYSDDNFADYDIIPQKIIDNKNKGYSRYFNQKYECLKENNSFYFNITIDSNICKYSIKDILNILKNHYSKVYQESKNGLKHTDAKVSKENDLLPNINIGGQTGFNTKVVLRVLVKDSEYNYIQKKKEILAKQFRRHNHDKCETAPRYLKVVNVNYDKGKPEYLSLGWCNISVEKEIDVSDITD